MRLIDADALKNKIEQHSYPLLDRINSIENGMFLCGIYQAIDESPTADVVPVVRGEWELFDECSNAGVYCSICHKAVYRESSWYKNVHIKSKYCPNCGAHMIGGTL